MFWFALIRLIIGVLSRGSDFFCSFFQMEYTGSMEVMFVEDEQIILEGMTEVVRRCEPQAQITACESAEEALQAIQHRSVDIALLDIEMTGMDGISLAGELKERFPQVNIIFATAYPQYTDRAMALHASGYILKPVTEEKLRRELADLRYSLEKPDGKLYIQTFGNFEVFFRGKPLQFRYSKTKEMLAYLVDRQGAMVSAGEIQAVLWEDSLEDKTSYYKQLRKDLFDTLREIGCEKAVTGARGVLGVICENVNCDYYLWMEGKAPETGAFFGEYMQQYSWAEATLGRLEMQKTI